MFRVVRDHVPLVVLGRQRDLGNALRSDVVLSGSQHVKFCLVRCPVEEAVLVIFKCQSVFHRGLFHTLTLFTGLSVVHPERVKL